MSSGIARWIPRRSTSSSMSKPCGPWPCPGREVTHEHPDHGRSRGRVSGVSTGAGLPTPDRRAAAPIVRPVCRRVGAPRATDDRGRPPLGAPAGADDPTVSGPPAGVGAGAGQIPGPARARHRDSTARAARPGPLPQDCLHLLRGRRRRADPSGSVARPVRWPAPPDILRPDRADGLYRVAHHRGPHPGVRRRRPGCRRPDGPPDQVPQVPAGPPAHECRRAASRLCRGPRPPSSVAAGHGLLPVGCRPANALRDRAAHVPPTAEGGDARGGIGRPRTAASPRPAAYVRVPPPDGLVSRQDGHRPGHRPALGLPRPCQGHRHLLVSDGCPGALGPGRPALRAVRRPNPGRCPMTPPFDILVQDFFCRRLIEQQGASPRTVEAYRDTFRLLLAYLPKRLGKPVPALCLADLDAPAVLAFLDHLETERGNGPRTRNARLAALRSFVQYAASRDPTAWPLTRRVLAIPSKRFTKPLLGYLTREEMQAVLNAPDAATWAGRRDRVLLAVTRLWPSGCD